jgi:hypothetical protein
MRTPRRAAESLFFGALMLPRNRLGEGPLGWPSLDRSLRSRAGSTLRRQAFVFTHRLISRGDRCATGGLTPLQVRSMGEGSAVSRLLPANSQPGTFAPSAWRSVARRVTTRRSGCFVPIVRLELPPQRAGGNQHEGAFFCGSARVHDSRSGTGFTGRFTMMAAAVAGVAEVLESVRTLAREHEGRYRRRPLKTGQGRSHRDATMETTFETRNPTDKPN